MGVSLWKYMFIESIVHFYRNIMTVFRTWGGERTTNAGADLHRQNQLSLGAPTQILDSSTPRLLDF